MSSLRTRAGSLGKLPWRLLRSIYLQRHENSRRCHRLLTCSSWSDTGGIGVLRDRQGLTGVVKQTDCVTYRYDFAMNPSFTPRTFSPLLAAVLLCGCPTEIVDPST